MTRTRGFVLAGLLVALLLGGIVSYYASTQPDGLNKVAADQGIPGAAGHASDGSPVAGYATKGVDDRRLSKGIAVTSGVLVCFALGGALTWSVRRRNAGSAESPTDAATGAQ